MHKKSKLPIAAIIIGLCRSHTYNSTRKKPYPGQKDLLKIGIQSVFWEAFHKGTFRQDIFWAMFQKTPPPQAWPYWYQLQLWRIENDDFFVQGAETKFIQVFCVWNIRTIFLFCSGKMGNILQRPWTVEVGILEFFKNSTSILYQKKCIFVLISWYI